MRPLPRAPPSPDARGVILFPLPFPDVTSYGRKVSLVRSVASALQPLAYTSLSAARAWSIS